MAIDANTSANLRDYEEQLYQLDSYDIRIPNQSLILDYFCIDHKLTDFLRDEVFLESSRRHDTWRKVNQSAADGSNRIVDDEISLLLDYKNNLSSRLWTDIVRLTACHQAHQELVDYIDRTSRWHLGHADYEQCSLSPGCKPEVKASATSTKNVNEQQSETLLSNVNIHSQNRQENKDTASVRNANISGLPMLVGSLALLGAFGVIISKAPYETTSTSQENSSSVSTASDTPDAVKRLYDLDAEQKSAVLVCEHQPIIEKGKSISLNELHNITKLDLLIASSEKQIKFLNQKSAKGNTYWEDPSCTWGQQWFDNHADKHFRLFLAISRKCTTPKLRYVYSKDEDRKTILSEGTYNAYGHSAGEIRIPYQGDAIIFVDKVTCS